jgi:uridine phosphorylase
VGVIASSDSFYLGQSRLGFKNYETAASRDLIGDLQKANVIGFEMETSTIFVLSNIYDLRAGSICAVYANRTKDEFVAGAGEKECVHAANEAVRILSHWDSLRNRAGRRWFYPDLAK